MSAIYPDDTTDTSFAGVATRLLGFAGRSNDTVGGVARTLLEAFAREMAIFYATLDAAHRSGFLDTAEGPALDHVVAILGIRRARAGRLTGKVEFSRAIAAQHDIVIPAGRRVTGVLADKPLPLFETVEEVVLARGQTRVVAEVQEVQEADSPAAPPLLNPGVLTIMPRPVLGVESVRNIEPLSRRQSDESDTQLRARAGTVLRESQHGTVEAIAAAVREQGVANVEVRELGELPPGVLRVIISDPGFEADTDAQKRVTAALLVAKPAGIRVQVDFQRTLKLALQAELELADLRLDERGRARVAAELADAVVQAAAGLPPAAAVRKQKLTAPLIAHPAIAGLQSATLSLRGIDLATRPALPGGDLYIGPLEAIALERADVKISWFRRPTLELELVVDNPGSADATIATVREVIGQYNDFIRAGGLPGLLFADLAARLSALKIGLRAVMATRDGVSTSERESDPVKLLKLLPTEIAALKDTEVVT